MLTFLPLALVVVRAVDLLAAPAGAATAQFDLATARRVGPDLATPSAAGTASAGSSPPSFLLACVALISTLKIVRPVHHRRASRTPPMRSSGQKIYDAKFDQGAGHAGRRSPSQADKVAAVRAALARVPGVHQRPGCGLRPARLREARRRARGRSVSGPVRTGCACRPRCRSRRSSGRTVVDVALTYAYDSPTGLRDLERIRDCVHAVPGAQALGRRPVGGQPGSAERVAARPQPDHPDGAGGDPDRAGAAAAGACWRRSC